MKRITGSIALASMLAAGLAFAGGDRTKGSAENPQAHEMERQAGKDVNRAWMKNDKMFLWRVHWINHSEIQSGELAAGNAQNEEVAAYGETLMQDHQQAETRLMELAESKGIDLQLTKAEYRTVRDKLGKHMITVMDLAHEEGSDFDRMFLTHMVKDHRNAIQLANAYRSETKDEEVRAYIDEILPVLQRHEKTASQLLDQIGQERRPVRGTDEPRE